MRMRTLLASTYLLNFLIGICATVYVLNSSLDYLETWQIPLHIYYVVLGFCGLVVASWVLIDGRRIETYAAEMRDLEKRILDLERQINRIKTVRLGGTYQSRKTDL